MGDTPVDQPILKYDNPPRVSRDSSSLPVILTPPEVQSPKWFIPHKTKKDLSYAYLLHGLYINPWVKVAFENMSDDQIKQYLIDNENELRAYDRESRGDLEHVKKHKSIQFGRRRRRRQRSCKKSKKSKKSKKRCGRKSRKKSS